VALNTRKFVNELINQGYTHLCVVPCSFVKYVINEAINNPNIQYLSCASEAVACSVAAGLKVAGSKPIVIAQSSGLANMGSCITSLLKPYDITIPILISWRTYKKDDSEIQHKHLAFKLPKLIEAYGYEHLMLDNRSLNTALKQINKCDKTHTIGIIKKDNFSKIELSNEHKIDLSKYSPRSEYLKKLNELYKNSDCVFIGTTGNTAREMYTFMSDTNNFYMVGNMGGALSLGLGMAKGGKKVFVLGGDGEFVMHMGGLTTAGRYKNEVDLTYIMFDNKQNKSTGGQNTYQSHMDYINIAKSSNFDVAQESIKDIQSFEQALQDNKEMKFIHVKCDIDEITPRPPMSAIVKQKI